jgi:hypothetical protein
MKWAKRSKNLILCRSLAFKKFTRLSNKPSSCALRQMAGLSYPSVAHTDSKILAGQPVNPTEAMFCPETITGNMCWVKVIMKR